jgi:hypothetical protein
MARRGVVLLLVLSFAAIRCGENVADVNSGAYAPPGNLKAYSVDRSTVQLEWTAPSGVNDSLFKDYLIMWANGTKEESISKGVLTYTVDSLNSGTNVFTLFSRDINNVVGTGASINWAPAERFPGPYTIYEARGTTADAAIDCGTDGGSPTTMPMDNNAAGKADFYFFGGQGQVNNPQVELVSADQWLVGNKVTLFSTVSHSSSTLNYFLSSFPATTTFTEPRIVVSAGTIYYAQLTDANSAIHYARILVTAILGAAPARNVRLQISLQRSVGVPYADAGDRASGHRETLAFLAPLLP